MRMQKCGADAEMRKYEDVDTRMRRCGCGDLDAEIWMRRCGNADVDAELPMQRCGSGSKVRKRMRRSGCGDADAEATNADAELWMRRVGCGCGDAYAWGDADAEMQKCGYVDAKMLQMYLRIRR